MKNKIIHTQSSAEIKNELPILGQMGSFSVILFAASLISPLFPKAFPVPAPVIGLIILYLLLVTHLVKLEWVERFADFMIGFISFLFVPSGIQLATSLDILKNQGLQLITIIVISTIILLVVIAYTATFFIWLKRLIFHRDVSVEEV
ncbi:murein hydrolase transporter LrgA [Lentilactobacillus fungorum]|uniref:Murein hydrolase transporter LrgA n=1 Tax=Lentilactobacillus fungorum TaxID=2201250 RepID=A0ABQ3W527_9LACO|nr:CidA/LrgA family protein [Lentilactobacillus fungorum]GHP15176.1 murein hydrolase transporter LrgA [Lentilactobacillus fungorum]